MSVQTGPYSTTHNAAYAGMPVDQQVRNAISKLNNTVAVIPFGKGVVTGDVDEAMALPGAGSVLKEFTGVVQYEINRAQQDGDVAGAVINHDGTVITKGVVWVVAAATVVKDDPAFLRVGATNLGDFSNAAGTGVTLSIALTDSKFLTPGGVGDLVQLSLGMGG